MPISATGNRRRQRSLGFTLVELMVVLAILGVVSAGVLFAMPDPRGSLLTEGERFAARLRAAQEQAIVQSADMAVAMDAAGYRFERRTRGRWQAWEGKPFTPERWPEGARAVLPADGARLTFDTTGVAEPMAVTLERDDARVVVSVGADGAIHVG